MSIAKQLAKSLGGEWEYSAGGCGWFCPDGRRVLRCCSGVDEWDNPTGPPEYWLYGDGMPRRAESLFRTPIACSFDLA